MFSNSLTSLSAKLQNLSTRKKLTSID